ncbi:MAG: hypothetical protein K8R87_11450, partial [Verrucomicrobia bacterium]|nr:hypothetical protein [Verrucomicrobiota bacterium]
KSSVPEWKQQKKGRSGDVAKDAAPEDKLESQIGGKVESTGVDVGLPDESSKKPALKMSEADVATAHRLDRWNLAITRFLILAAVLILVADYLRRANIYSLATFPLRLPSVLLNSMTPMPPLVNRSHSPRRSIPEELEWLARRGDSFVYLTDNPAAASAALAHFESRQKRKRPQVLRVTDGQDAISDEFVFESLWFGRGSFVVDSIERMEYMLPRFIKRLEQRRATRARVRQTAHIVWDVSAPLPESARETLVNLARSTGFSLLLQ